MDQVCGGDSHAKSWCGFSPKLKVSGIPGTMSFHKWKVAPTPFLHPHRSIWSVMAWFFQMLYPMTWSVMAWFIQMFYPMTKLLDHFDQSWPGSSRCFTPWLDQSWPGSSRCFTPWQNWKVKTDAWQAVSEQSSFAIWLQCTFRKMEPRSGYHTF